LTPPRLGGYSLVEKIRGDAEASIDDGAADAAQALFRKQMPRRRVSLSPPQPRTLYVDTLSHADGSRQSQSQAHAWGSEPESHAGASPPMWVTVSFDGVEPDVVVKSAGAQPQTESRPGQHHPQRVRVPSWSPPRTRGQERSQQEPISHKSKSQSPSRTEGVLKRVRGSAKLQSSIGDEFRGDSGDVEWLRAAAPGSVAAEAGATTMSVSQRDSVATEGCSRAQVTLQTSMEEFGAVLGEECCGASSPRAAAADDSGRRHARELQQAGSQSNAADARRGQPTVTVMPRASAASVSSMRLPYSSALSHRGACASPPRMPSSLKPLPQADRTNSAPKLSSGLTFACVAQATEVGDDRPGHRPMTGKCILATPGRLQTIAVTVTQRKITGAGRVAPLAGGCGHEGGGSSEAGAAAILSACEAGASIQAQTQPDLEAPVIRLLPHAPHNTLDERREWPGQDRGDVNDGGKCAPGSKFQALGVDERQGRGNNTEDSAGGKVGAGVSLWKTRLQEHRFAASLPIMRSTGGKPFGVGTEGGGVGGTAQGGDGSVGSEETETDRERGRGIGTAVGTMNRLSTGGSHRKTALRCVDRAAQFLRLQIREAFWAVAQTKSRQETLEKIDVTQERPRIASVEPPSATSTVAVDSVSQAVVPEVQQGLLITVVGCRGGPHAFAVPVDMTLDQLHRAIAARHPEHEASHRVMGCGKVLSDSVVRQGAPVRVQGGTDKEDNNGNPGQRMLSSLGLRKGDKIKVVVTLIDTTKPRWVLDKKLLGRLLHSLQIHLCDPIRDAAVIMEALDVDGSGSIDVDEFSAAFECTIADLQMSSAEFSRSSSCQQPARSGAPKVVRENLLAMIKRGKEAKEVETLLMDIDSIMQKTFSSLVTCANMERDAVFEAFLSAGGGGGGPAGGECAAWQEFIWMAILLQRNYMNPPAGVMRAKRHKYLLTRLRFIIRHPAVQCFKDHGAAVSRDDEGSDVWGARDQGGAWARRADAEGGGTRQEAEDAGLTLEQQEQHLTGTLPPHAGVFIGGGRQDRWTRGTAAGRGFPC